MVEVVTVVVVVEVTVKGAATVVVIWVTPMQEQALEYQTLPEQADAYEGIAVADTVAWRTWTRGLGTRALTSLLLRRFIGSKTSVVVVVVCVSVAVLVLGSIS